MTLDEWRVFDVFFFVNHFFTAQLKILSHFLGMLCLYPKKRVVLTMAGEPESEPERPEPHNLAGAGAEAGASLFFFLEPEHFKILEWSQSWSPSWHKLVRLQQFLKNFQKNNDFWYYLAG